ncbi:hypothetical protein [Paenibacillus sp. FJAT-27812]|uniref:hypothetical protein n=1 Tax=Paenibacillus sp. FJAT-27812 TaxID=1684143 RepID=UPI0006A762B0|nr:hypothetical protein [Paenibacillus sp. FJAT-27812]
MVDQWVHLLIRKFFTTYIVTVLASFLMAFTSVFGKGEWELARNSGNELIGWMFVYIMYIGTIVLFFGNGVSLVLEWVRVKGIIPHSWIIVVLHGIFGMALGLLFPYWLLVLYGMATALGYGIIDWWLRVRPLGPKGMIIVALSPVILYGVSWGTLQFLSPPMPPFTIEEAVAFATAGGDGTSIGVFPDEIGRWQGTVDGYQVVRETSARVIANNEYIVTFSESWTKDAETNSRYLSYRVERSGMIFYKREGEDSPYLKRK